MTEENNAVMQESAAEPLPEAVIKEGTYYAP